MELRRYVDVVTYDELMTALKTTTVDEWQRVDSWGPKYRDWIVTEPGRTIQEARTAVLSHDHAAVYRSNLSLTMAWGLEPDRDAFTFDRDRDKDFGVKFPDANHWVEIADVFWNNALVYRTHYLHVDGGRAILPLPRAAADLGEVDGDPQHRSVVHADELCLIRTIDQLMGRQGMDANLARTGWRIN